MKTIRVFVSSTFRDMHAERDYLNRFVFPELRSRCARYDAEFIGVDLRWGVTRDEAEQQGALSICLEEIERCRPFFVCLLGDRYGWAAPPEEIAQDFFDRVLQGPLDQADQTFLKSWYARDAASVPAVYRLRRACSGQKTAGGQAAQTGCGGSALTQDVIERLNRLGQTLGLPQAGESITALEILRAAFDPSRPQTHSFFYLRRSGLEEHPDFPSAMRPVFLESDPVKKSRLVELKARIRRQSGHLSVREYAATYAGLRMDSIFLPPSLSDEERERLKDGVIQPAEWNALSEESKHAFGRHGTVALTGMEDLGQMILDDLWAVIEPMLQRELQISADKSLHRPYHERFAVDRTRLFIGREALLQQIIGYASVAADRQPLVVTGLAGSGKSALLAEAARRLKQAMPDAVVISHFIGAAPGSTDLLSTVRSLCESLRHESVLQEQLPVEPQKLRLQLPVFLERAGSQRPIVLFLDALNQLDPAWRAHELDWLPLRLASGVKLIVSTLAGLCLDRLKLEIDTAHLIHLSQLPQSDRARLIDQHLAQRTKRLTAQQVASLLDTSKRPEIGLPLYLRVALEEICLFGDFETLGERIEKLPPSVAELFDQVLQRLELDHGSELAEQILTRIAAARSGLLENEVLDLLEPASDFPRLRWTRFYRALEPYLRPVEESTGEGLISFFHDQLRFAVFRRYLQMTSPDTAPTQAFRQVHWKLAQYFQSTATTAGNGNPWRTDKPRSLAELPYHLTAAGRSSSARSLSLDFDWLTAKLQALGPGSLLEDYEMLPADSALSPAQDALRLSLDVVAEDQLQFASQLSGRLLACRDPDIRALLDRIQQNAPRPWLRPLSQGLTQAGSALRLTLGKHTHPVRGVAISPEGRLAVSAADDKTVRIWDIRSGAEIRVLQGHEAELLAVTVSPNGQHVASAGHDRQIRIWDLQTGKLVRTLVGHSEPVSALAFLPDGGRLLSGSYDTSLRLWDIAAGSEIMSLRGHAFGVNAVAVARNGARAVSGSYDRSVKVWDLETGRHLRTLDGHQAQVFAVAVAPDSHFALTGSEDCTLKLWDLQTGTELRTFAGHTEPVTAVAILPDGKRGISASWDRTLKIWDLQTAEEIGTYWGHTYRITGLAVTSDGARAVSAGWDTTLKVWDLKAPQSSARVAGHGANIPAAAITPDGRLAVTGSWDKTVKLWDLCTGTELRTLTGHEDLVRDLAITPDGRRILSASFDRTIRVWELETGQLIHVLRGHEGQLTRVAVTREGHCAVSIGQDRTLRTWNLDTGKEIAELRRFAEAACLALSPDGRFAVLGTYFPPVVLLIEISSGWVRAMPRAHRSQINAVAVDPAGRFILSASSDRTIRIWDFSTGKELESLLGHSREIWSLAVSGDGTLAASVSDDRCLIVWDLPKRSILARFSGEGALVPCAMSPDGKYIATGDEAGALHLLRFEI